MMIKILINKKSIIAVFLLLCNLAFSQGLIEVPLHTNQVLIDKWKDIKNSKAWQQTPSIGDTLTIPSTGLLDDFSYNGPFPDTSLWLNFNVFVNRNYPIAPPTIGVATFDGINKYGYPYDFQVGQTSSSPADTLTSKRIHLDNILPNDSIYLSFYYQPQGRGNTPEYHDSLVLEFKEKRLDSIAIHDTLAHVGYTISVYDSASGSYLNVALDSFIVHSYDSLFIKEVWQHIWSKRGATTPTDSSWKLVMIPITDTAFLKPGFQFRFYNWATISGNGDQWSIDNVYLNHNSRSWHDTIMDDVALVYEPVSLLKNYYSMPWRHYIDTTLCKDTVTTLIRNNSLAVKLVGMNYSEYDLTNSSLIYQSATDNPNVDPYYSNGYHYYGNHLMAIPTGLTGPSDYKFQVNMITGDVNRRNDTVKHIQSFSNYFAYDDGSAESAFAMNSTLIGELAEQFTTTVPDTLQAIDIYFNPLWHDASLYQESFNIKVWNDYGGHPGSVIYTDNAQTPWYNEQEYGPDHFKRYHITPQYITPQTLYIGFLQNTSQELSVGVDKNTNSQYKIFYNTTGLWYNSPYPGSLMMRPVFGTHSECTGVTNSSSNTISFSVYPNPANDKLNIKYNATNASDKISYSIIDVYGRAVLENNLSNTNQQSIDISTLSEGVYFIRLTDSKIISTNKFIKIK